jgi:hypothetical protein
MCGSTFVGAVHDRRLTCNPSGLGEMNGDIAGHVEAVGRDVGKFQPGDEVYGDLCTRA